VSVKISVRRTGIGCSAWVNRWERSPKGQTRRCAFPRRQGDQKYRIPGPPAMKHDGPGTGYSRSARWRADRIDGERSAMTHDAKRTRQRAFGPTEGLTRLIDGYPLSAVCQRARAKRNGCTEEEAFGAKCRRCMTDLCPRPDPISLSGGREGCLLAYVFEAMPDPLAVAAPSVCGGSGMEIGPGQCVQTDRAAESCREEPSQPRLLRAAALRLVPPPEIFMAQACMAAASYLTRPRARPASVPAAHA
jgi:hypothetical protein